MFGQISLDLILFFMLYGMGTATAVGACLYLLLRRGNAFAPEVTPPMRLRRWTAAFFAVLVVGHFWYLPAAVLTDEDVKMCMLVGGLLDCVLTIPMVIVVMLCMLQDRRRPLWPAWVLMLPPVVGMLAYMATCSSDYLSLAHIYFLLMSIGLFVYMMRAVWQYGRWLRDNYADLEHKEVWQTFVVLAVIVLVFGYYVSGDGSMTYEYIVQVLCIVLICHLLWRVETLSDLGIPVASDAVVCVEDAAAETAATEDAVGDGEIPSSEALSDATFEQIGSMLKQRCEDTRLYLHHGLTLAQLTQAVGTNRFYLSQYFSSLDMNYNAYINNLRINHFVSLYHEAVDSKRSFTVQQLALESGFHCYTTFSDAFKRKMGLSVRSWIKAARPEGKAQHEGLGEP